MLQLLDGVVMHAIPLPVLHTSSAFVGGHLLALLLPSPRFQVWKSSVAPSSVWAPKQLAAVDPAIASVLQPGDPVDLSQLWDAAATDLAVQFACKTDAVAGQRVYARVA